MATNKAKPPGGLANGLADGLASGREVAAGGAVGPDPADAPGVAHSPEMPPGPDSPAPPDPAPGADDLVSRMAALIESGQMSPERAVETLMNETVRDLTGSESGRLADELRQFLSAFVTAGGAGDPAFAALHARLARAAGQGKAR